MKEYKWEEISPFLKEKLSEELFVRVVKNLEHNKFVFSDQDLVDVGMYRQRVDLLLRGLFSAKFSLEGYSFWGSFFYGRFDKTNLIEKYEKPHTMYRITHRETELFFITLANPIKVLTRGTTRVKNFNKLVRYEKRRDPLSFIEKQFVISKECTISLPWKKLINETASDAKKVAQSVMKKSFINTKNLFKHNDFFLNTDNKNVTKKINDYINERRNK